MREWRCAKCGQMISEEPCPYCGSKYLTVDITKIWNLENTAAAPEVPKIDKRSSASTAAVPKKLEEQPGVLFHLLVTGIVIAVIAVICVFVFMVSQSTSSQNDAGTVVYGVINDWYDDDGDGWVDRYYDKVQGKWYYSCDMRISQVN